ncbi:MAG TPA: rRNA maturation RNase YbeY, partial [Polyangiaceae bacterium]|nr:rRNA maturation RNase YbeY [Polyangiaceae bacterium]
MRRLAEAMLRTLELPHSELSVLLTDDTTIHELNRQHRQKDKPTDVLAFPLDEKGEDPARPWLGDVVISIDTALRQAESRRRELVAEVRFLLAHGLLHLIGYDHDTKPRKREMDAAARRLVRSAPLEERLTVRPDAANPHLAAKPRADGKPPATAKARAKV